MTTRTPRTPDTRAPSTDAATGKRQPTKRSAAKRKASPAHTAPASGDLTVLASVRQDLAEIAKADPALASSGLAALALALAREMDEPDNSATSKSMCAGQLRDVLDRLRELTPAADEKDALDDLARRRSERIARQSGATA